MIDEAADRSAAARAAFAAPVPKELLARFPGKKPRARWEQVFGARARRRRAVHGLALRPLRRDGRARRARPPIRCRCSTNAALNRPGKAPGQYPSGGPLPHLFDVWKAGAPSLDLLAPDIYLPDFAAWCDRYQRPGNPLFIPEARNDADAAVHALYAIGRGALGFSPFAIENAGEAARPRCEGIVRGAGRAGAADRRRRRPGSTAGVLLDKEHPTEAFQLRRSAR